MKWKIAYKTPEWVAVWSALICGVATHMFGLVNVLNNIDDIAQQPYGYGTGITSGRWLLSFLGDIMLYLRGSYNLPFLNGILFLCLLALSAGVVVNILDVKSCGSAALMGMLFVTLPSVAATMFFRYTTVYYGIAVLLTVLSVWILERKRFGFILSAVFLACSMGIYQAYVPMAISLYILLLIQGIIKGSLNLWQLIRRGLYYCAVLLVGLILYYGFLKLFLNLYNTQLSDYNGVNDMGKLALSDLPVLIKKALYYVLMMPVKNYSSLANSGGIRISYVLLGCVTAVMIGYHVLKNGKQQPLLCIALILLCAVFLLAVNFIIIMCPTGWIYTLMVYPFVLLGCMPLVLSECLLRVYKNDGKEFREGTPAFLRFIVSLITAALVFFYAYDVNVEYSCLYYGNQQTRNYLNAMVIQVRMTDGFDTNKEWAFLGEIEDPLLRTPWQYEVRYGGNEPVQMMINRQTRYDWIQHYFGYSLPLADEQTVEQLWKLNEVQQMPCWPNEGSVCVIGDTVVIKCQETP